VTTPKIIKVAMWDTRGPAPAWLVTLDRPFNGASMVLVPGADELDAFKNAQRYLNDDAKPYEILGVPYRDD
jgi:hypothetical protein